MVHTIALSMEQKGMMSAMSANYYEIGDYKTTPSSTPRHCGAFLFTATVALATIAWISHIAFKGGVSNVPLAHISVIKLLPPSTLLKSRLQGDVVLQETSPDRKEVGRRSKKLRHTEARQDIDARVLRAQSAANAAQDAKLMARAAEAGAKVAGAMAKEAAKAAHDAVKVAAKEVLEGGQEAGNGDAKGKADAGEAEAAATSTVDSKVAAAMLNAMAANGEAKQAAKGAEEAMVHAEEVSGEAKDLQDAAQQAAEEAAVALGVAKEAGRKADRAEIEAVQALKAVEEMRSVEREVETKALEEALAEAKKAVTRFDQLAEVAMAAEQTAKEAAEFAKEAAHAAEMVALEARHAAVDASDATAMAEQAAQAASEAAEEAARANHQGRCCQGQWTEVGEGDGYDPLILQ